MGCALNLLGFSLFYAKAANIWGVGSAISYTALMAIVMLGSNGSSWFDAAVCGSTVAHFPTKS